MQLDALMGNDISVISHFTFTQSAPEPSFQPNIFSSIHRRKCSKNSDRIMQCHNYRVIVNSFLT